MVNPERKFIRQGTYERKCTWFISLIQFAIVFRLLSTLADTPPVHGLPAPGLESFDDLMLGFAGDMRVPGLSLAVVKNGKLVLARGYGWADQEAREPVKPESLFRIASISKPVTAAAVLRLAETTDLDLDMPITRHLPPGTLPETNAIKDQRIHQITLRHLLHHTAGFDREVSYDPMFRARQIAHSLQVSCPPSPIQIIRFVLQNPLDFSPGERYAYSNIGYNLLGRAIEHQTGRSYEEYVQDAILRPLGIHRMRLGRTLLQHRFPGEVKYYDHRRRTRSVFGKDSIWNRVERPYGAWDLEAMDAHGGWLASAVDLVRFGSRLLNSKTSPLSPESLAMLRKRPSGSPGFDPDGKEKVVYYGCGWSIRVVPGKGLNLWHSGLLDGTASLLVSRHDGLCWAVLFNSRSGKKAGRQNLARAIDPLVHRAAAKVREWPDVDLFPSFFPSR